MSVLNQAPTDMPQGSVENVTYEMKHRGVLIRVGTFIGAAVIAGVIALITTESLAVAATLALVAGAFTVGAATFITAICTQATVAKREEFDQADKPTND